ncbi:MAG TPA: dephospho-CoA kinase [Terracidiphilus sp.]|nr:dephospho-CoA kinase [Terracidiphilus sp.]
MLRVGLTGGLGSGKSTVAAMLRELGAAVIESDEQGRALMEPGQACFDEIVRVFGAGVVAGDGRLNRARLAEMAFKEGRVRELNAIVHPAVIEAQRQWTSEVFARDPAAVAVIVSALIFEVERDARDRGERDNLLSHGVLSDWRRRMDRVVVVIAPDDVRIARYVARLGPGADREAAEADARARLAVQIPDAEKAARADYVLENAGDRETLRHETAALWERLKAESNKLAEGGFL